MFSGTVLDSSGSPIRGFIFENLKSLGLWLLSNWYWFVGFVVTFIVVVYLYKILWNCILTRLQK